MESLTLTISPLQAGVPQEKAEKIALAAMQYAELFEDPMNALAEACRVLQEAKGRHRRLAFPLAEERQQKVLLGWVDDLLAATDWPLKKISRAGEEWIVDTSTLEYEKNWRQHDK